MYLDEKSKHLLEDVANTDDRLSFEELGGNKTFGEVQEMVEERKAEGEECTVGSSDEGFHLLCWRE